MRVEKVINNNLVHSFDDNGIECIVMGKAIGFKKQIGDPIDDKIIEKVYKITDTCTQQQFTQLVVDIPLEHLQVANMIIDYAKNALSYQLRDEIYVSLTDHINYALERLANGIKLENRLLYETKHYYNREFMIGLEAIKIVDQVLGIKLPEDEAAFIAMHLVESSSENTQSEFASMSLTLIQSVVNIIKYHFNLELQDSSLAYERLIVHLRYFSGRVLSNKVNSTCDEQFMRVMLNNFSDEYECVKKIQKLVKDEYGYDISNDEIVYLCVHIHRVLMDK